MVKTATTTIVESEKKHQRLDVRQEAKKLDISEIRLIIKADVAGSLEAITNALENIKSEDQKVKIYFSGTGDIIESDVLLAAATGSLLLGFNVSITKAAERLASEEKVLIRRYSLIHELLEEFKEGLSSLSEEKVKEEIFGEAEIIKTFEIGDSQVAGCRVVKGRVNKNDMVVVKRDGKELTRSRVTSMKHQQSDINEAHEGEEFGLILEKKVNFPKGGIISAIGSSVN